MDDDFLAMYQMNYGFTSVEDQDETANSKDPVPCMDDKSTNDKVIFHQFMEEVSS